MIPGRSLVLMLIFLCSLSCSSDSEMPEEQETDASCSNESLLEQFTAEGGEVIFIYEDGKAFTQEPNSCEFLFQYFDPDFASDNYTTMGTDVFFKVDNELVPIKNDFQEDFETKSTLSNLFSTDISSPDLFWTNMTLQSPATPEVEEYVALSKCILDGSCDFIDNKLEIVPSPTDSDNTVLKFTAIAPTANMVTSKTSISTILNYFVKGADLWFEADYYIISGKPFTLVDFETSYFEVSPGPRVVLRNNKLGIENKFGAKLEYPGNGPDVPVGAWFKLKVHLQFSSTDNGIIELWQDGEQVVNATGINLPTSNAIQNILEMGISATQEGCELLVDNMRISDTAF